MSNPMEMNNLNKNEQKPVANKFAALHQDEPISADIYNLSNPDALPAPLVVSKRNAADKYKNKIVLLLENKSADRIVLGGLHRTGIYINLNDLMAVSDMHRIRVTVEDKPAQTNLVYPMFTFPGVVDPELRDPSVPPMPNNEHLGIDPVFYIWLEDEIELGQYDRIKVVLEGVVSDFQPALRYIDLSWDFRRIDYSGGSLTYAPLEGFHQLTVQLQRPIDYLEPPLPVQAHWLNNNNVMYSSKGTKEAIQNELTFAFSNTGLQDFVLDCSRHSKGAPYFELVMVAIEDRDEGDFSSAVGKVSELKDAQLKNTTPDPDLNQLWRTNKRIQGPVVKWEIRPDLNFETEQELGRYQENKKILIGIDRKATITFQLSNLVSSLEAGVALVYFKYYNMPEHDDGQLVLFLEKREVGKPATLTPQLPVADNQMTPPLQWDYKEEKGSMKTVVTLGDRVGIGTENPKHAIDFGTTHRTLALYSNNKGEDIYGFKVSSGNLNFHVSSNTINADPKMVIKANGNVGIGIEDPG
jgi:hypothetical protein